jgi:hypothetical protein
MIDRRMSRHERARLAQGAKSMQPFLHVRYLFESSQDHHGMNVEALGFPADGVPRSLTRVLCHMLSMRPLRVQGLSPD